MKDIKVSLIALGCSKNLIDAECMIKLLMDDGFTMTEDYTKAQVVVINTCGFIDSAVSEAINTILEVADSKTPNGNVEYIVVTGCMPQRYSKDILKDLPEVDAVLGTSHYQDICKVINSLINSKENEVVKNEYVSEAGGIAHLTTDRYISTGSYAWLKIGEGCRNKCTYCAIPLIRGDFISRKMEDILAEAENLVNRGYKELILAAQDTTNYGIDLYGERRLHVLLNNLAKIDGLELIRVMYGYMDGLDDNIINEFKNNPKVAHYMDIPIQHGDDKVLKAMNRRDTTDIITERLKKLREAVPDIVIRTTVMVGFPGETEEAFNNLKNNLKKWKFDRLGCFMFSPQEGTAAYSMENQVPEDVKQSRYDEIYQLQSEIAKENNQKRLETVTSVRIDSISDDGIFYIGRSNSEAPEVDPVIFVVAGEKELEIGQVYDVKIVDCSEYDMTGVCL